MVFLLTKQKLGRSVPTRDDHVGVFLVRSEIRDETREPNVKFESGNSRDPTLLVRHCAQDRNRQS